MGLLRRGRPATEADALEISDDVFVVSPKAADLAVSAQKERRKAARAERLLAETQEATLLGDKKALKAAKKRRKNEPEDDDDDLTGTAADPLTGAKIKRYIGIARIVVPVVAPIVYQAVGMARDRWDAHRARQFGVAPDELAEFTGRGAALYARIHNLALSARDLRARYGDGDDARATEVRSFVDDAQQRLTDLESAVRAAEQMPGSRRRSAHVAVGGELDRIENRLLARRGADAHRDLRRHRPLLSTPELTRSGYRRVFPAHHDRDTRPPSRIVTSAPLGWVGSPHRGLELAESGCGRPIAAPAATQCVHDGRETSLECRTYGVTTSA